MSLDFNLDREAQLHSQEIVAIAVSTEMENRLRRSLAILQEQGVYAVVLYLFKKEKEGGARIAAQLLLLAQKIAPDPKLPPGREVEVIRISISAPKNDLPDIRRALLQRLSNNVAGDIHTLLLVKQLWEQTLIYARYACKLD